MYPDLLFLDYQLDFMGAHLDGLIAAVATYAAKSHQLHLTLCDPMDCSSPGSSVHGISQARILEWVAISFSRGPSQPKDGPGSPALQADSLPCEPPGKTHMHP